VKHRRKVVGAQTLIGKDAVVSTPCRPVGQVRLDGEIWEARCESGASPGDRVRVVGRKGLTLLVEATA
jgi:membrane-bound serine protease (ClpP class)